MAKEAEAVTARRRESPIFSRGFGLALVFSFLFHVLHGVALPLVVPWDGHEYYFLSTLFGAENFEEKFVFVRTPIYPAFLHLAFLLFGVTPAAVIGLNITLHFLAVLLLAHVIRKLAGNTAAILGIVCLSVSPLAITYQHTLLTETASGFCFALLAAAALEFFRRQNLRASATLGCVLGFCYYVRPTYLYLSPVLAILISLLPLSRVLGHRVKVSVRRAFLMSFLTLGIPFLITAPWRSMAQSHNGMWRVYAMGMLNQAFIPPDRTDLLGEGQRGYQEAIERGARGGRLHADGLPDLDILNLMPLLPSSTRLESERIFRELIWEHPLSYAAAVLRTSALYLGAHYLESENDLFSEWVLSGKDYPMILSGPRGWLLSPSAQLTTIPRPSAIQKLEYRLYHVTATTWFMRLFHCFSIALLAMAFVRKDLALAVLPLLTFSFYALHALVLLSLDRYAAPAIPLELSAMLIFAARALRWMTSPVVAQKNPELRKQHRRTEAEQVYQRAKEERLREDAQEERRGLDEFESKKSVP